MPAAARPRLGDNGRHLGHIKAILDIDDWRWAGQHRTLPIDELNHGVKKTLAIVQSTAHQSLSSDEAPVPALVAFEGRLGGLAAAHGLPTRLTWEAPDGNARPAIRPVCGDTVADGEGDARVEPAAVPVRLRQDQVVSMAIALHEPATSALKRGPLSTGDGRIDIDREVSPGAGDGTPPRLRSSGTESGGAEVASPGGRGFGSRLIERAPAAESGETGSLVFRPEGCEGPEGNVCRMQAPLSKGMEGS